MVMSRCQDYSPQYVFYPWTKSGVGFLGQYTEGGTLRQASIGTFWYLFIRSV